MTTPEQRRLLGAFVRARREALRPETPGARRRTPGLRREELAARAGIGVTWVSWIEQGREVSPSAHSLARLAGALQLGRAERAYLFELAGRRDPDDPFAAPEGAAPAALAAVAGALGWPAYGLDPAWHVVCCNPAARRLLTGLDGEGDHPNLLRWAFTSPAARALLPDWEDRAARLLAEFRADYGRHPDDPAARAVVAWLTGESALFRACWERQAVTGRAGGLRRFRHPEDGDLTFRQHTLRADDRADFKLVALEPVPSGAERSGDDQP
ncbi:helix-turn-helix domain-containing protein [Novosphingobium flavum]|uniref:Helix-turn-helix domain-containing protein n=1 Tax=Novosphingobium flavum TaxID=1778672 RepID=A0A7X1FSC1_9SPHN|nr:helix-turn-helix transcriptional regulator [Novosphingobium flavum]MBC2666068.1 helix-turn-helix domain-containing protein [Novosphingobium flavum]